MSIKYFVQVSGKEEGPYDTDEVKRKNLKGDSLVWHEGLENWTAISQVAELRDKKPPPISSSKPKNSGKSIWKYLRIGGLILLSLIGYEAYIQWENNNSSSASYGNQSYEQKIMSVTETEEMYPTRFLDASGTYRENLLGDKLKVNGTITSSATVARYKDATVRVTYYSKTKTNLGSEDYTIYEVLNPGRTTPFRLKIKNYRNVNSIGWDVVDADVY